MLAALARWSLDRPRLIAWACVWLLICGLVYIRDIKLAFLPDIAPARAIVQTEAPGLVAEQVEQLVTRPVESALAGTAGVAHVHSQSVQGLSVVTLTFASAADPLRVRQALAENLSSLGGALPAGAGAPRLAPMSAAGGDALQIGFTSDKLDPMALRDLIEWTVRPRLLAAPGVARVTLFGGQTRRIEVRARPGDLSDSDLGFLDILNATRRATGVAGAGFIDTPTQRVLIEPHGQALTADQIGAGQIQTPGADPVRIADVADVFDNAPAPSFGDALIDGKPGVMGVIVGQSGSNTLQVNRATKQALDLLQPALTAQGVMVARDLDEPASFVTRMLRGLALDLAVGVVLIAAALLVFMREPLAALVSLVSIPLSLLVAVMALKALGWTLNVMTVGGLILALGVVIDDAVIDVENILARLREADRRHASHADAILAACLEVRGPVIYATLAMIVTVLPLLGLPGAQGALLQPLAGAVIAACLASLTIAAVVTPALAFLALRHVGPEPAPRARRLVRLHQAGLGRLGRAPRSVLLAGVVIVALALGALMFARPMLMPSIHDDHLVVDIAAPPSTSLDAMRAYGARIATDLEGLAGVTSVVQRIGRDPTGEGGAGLESSRFDIGLRDGLSAGGQAAVAGRVGRVLDIYPGLNPTVRTRFDADLAGADAPAPFSVSVFGSDLDSLDDAAGQIVAALKTVPGGASARIESDAKAPVVRVDLNFNRLAIYGLSAADVLDTIQAAFAGERVATVYDGGRAIDVAVSAQASLRQDPETVGNLLLRSTSGISEPLKAVANVYLTDTRAEIAHDNGLRRQVVVVDPPPDRVASFADAARAAIGHQVRLPPGAYLEYASTYQASVDAERDLVIRYALSLFAVVALLSVAFDGRAAALIAASTLFSAIGASLAVLAMGGGLSVGEIAGFIALFGLGIRSAILLISRLEDLALEPHHSWSLAAVIRASGERLIPLLASAALVILGLLPIAVQAGAAGFEILGPMAIVIICGLITGTLASLFVLPITVFAFWRPGYARLARGHRTSAPPPAV